MGGQARAADGDPIEVLSAALAGQAEVFELLQGALDGITVCHMNRDASKLADVQWIAQCAHRLREQWPRADVVSLDETALALWEIDWLRLMPAEEAAALWLAPLRRG